jgi:hypothetical protein
LFLDEQVTVEDIIVWAARRSVRLQFADTTVADLTGDIASFSIPETALSFRRLLSIQLFVKGTQYQVVLNPIDRRYYADVIVPAPGTYDAVFDIQYEGAVDRAAFTLKSVPRGTIADGVTGISVSGATVELLDIAAGGHLWPAADFDQRNPQGTGADGAYGFVVPNGQYQLHIVKSGYHDRRTLAFAVNNHLINQRLTLIPKTPPLVIRPEAPLAENVVTVGIFLGKKAGEYTALAAARVSDGIATVEAVADNPVVESVTERYVAPAAIGIAVTTVVPSLWSILLPLFRFLFLQPLLVLGKKKREAWGQVYNAFTKLPVDLAMVRLVDAESGRVVQTRVTDATGRYLFVAEPGTYRIEVGKKDFSYPSALLAGEKSDGRLVDIYHGEQIAVTEEGATVTPNIPLDPAGQAKMPARIVREKRLRIAQHIISMTGIATTLIAFAISPAWYIAAFLGLHFAMYASFVRYVAPKKPKGWGVVYDRASRVPIHRVVARLFTKAYDKLVDTQMTDTKGRYAFLVGPNEYYVVFEREGYEKRQTDALDLRGRKEERIVVKEDVPLERTS